MKRDPRILIVNVFSGMLKNRPIFTVNNQKKILPSELRAFGCSLYACKAIFQCINMFTHMFLQYFDHIKLK